MTGRDTKKEKSDNTGGFPTQVSALFRFKRYNLNPALQHPLARSAQGQDTRSRFQFLSRRTLPEMRIIQRARKRRPGLAARALPAGVRLGRLWGHLGHLVRWFEELWSRGT